MDRASALKYVKGNKSLDRQTLAKVLDPARSMNVLLPTNTS